MTELGRSLARRRVVNAFDEVELADGVASEGGTECTRKVSELGQILAQVELWDVVDDIEQCHTRTCVANRLVRKPNSIWTGDFLFVGVIDYPSIEKYETVYWKSGTTL